MKPPEPILVTDLFSPILDALIQLLSDLTPAEWARPTVCVGWTVKDVALHLLAVDIGNLSRRRDGHFLESERPIRSEQDLLAFINFLNESWLTAAQRISPPLLVDLLRFVGEQTNAFFVSLNPFALGDPVSWAGPDPAPVWLDLTREYTERWHHQQHIRDALGKPGLKEPRFFAPILDAFVRALPHTYRDISAPEGTLITLSIMGDLGGQWSIWQEGKRWVFYVGTEQTPAAKITIDQEHAWRLFTKGLGASQVCARTSLSGDEILGAQVFQMVSIIA
jgi:uncharacterized protein (TIGR03083 family)